LSKKQCCIATDYDKYEAFKNSIDNRFKANMQTLMTMKFQLFSEKTENLTV